MLSVISVLNTYCDLNTSFCLQEPEKLSSGMNQSQYLPKEENTCFFQTKLCNTTQKLLDKLNKDEYNILTTLKENEQGLCEYTNKWVCMQYGKDKPVYDTNFIPKNTCHLHSRLCYGVDEFNDVDIIFKDDRIVHIPEKYLSNDIERDFINLKDKKYNIQIYNSLYQWYSDVVIDEKNQIKLCFIYDINIDIPKGFCNYYDKICNIEYNDFNITYLGEFKSIYDRQYYESKEYINTFCGISTSVLGITLLLLCTLFVLHIFKKPKNIKGNIVM